ncbi:MAG TPA: PAS domain S-box protein, partial [Telluria sp.]|nr:PAS domain S-box protein [Telluria sp.]
FFYMMTFDGILIEHPDRSRLLEHINTKPGVNAATQRALAGFEGWTEARNKAGSEGIYAYKRLGNVNWIVAARFPTEEAFAPLIDMRGQTIAAGAMFALLAAFLGWYAVTRMVAPLQRLREHVGSVRAHRADLSVLKSRRDDEVGELARSFHALVADRQSAQERTRDSEALVRNILDRAPDAFISTDADGRITEWNGRAEELFGWTREEALGRDVADLIIPEYMRAAHKAGMARFGVTGSGPVINTRMRVTARHRSGRSIPIEISVGAVPHEGEHYATAFLHDISDRLAYEEQIKASERRARIIADTMPILISYVDDQERFQFTNAYYQELLGVDPRSLIGKTVLEVRGAATYDQLKEHIDAALRGQRVHFEHEGVENGRHVYFIIDYIPDVAPDGRVAGFYSMVTDISERRGAELRQAASEKRLKLITDHMPALIAYIDSEGRFQFGNATFRTWFGIAPEEMAGRPLDQVITARTLDLAQDHLPRAFAGQTVTYEFRAERNGHSRDLRLTLVPDQQADGVVAGVYALAQDMTDVKAAQEKLIQLARIDSLTGIANRRSFGETLAQAVERARRHHLLIALAYLDVDHFKKINDTYGHATGDEVLKEFAHRMVASVRSSDIVARLSGDEFVIILGDLKEAAEAATIAQKIVDAVRVPFELAGATVNVTTSVGIAVFEGGTQTQVQLLANADKALYEAKRLGRNGFAVYTPAAGMEPAA